MSYITGRETCLHNFGRCDVSYLFYIHFEQLAARVITECILCVRFGTWCIVKFNCHVIFFRTFLIIVVANYTSHIGRKLYPEYGELLCNYYIRLFWSHIGKWHIFDLQNNIFL